MFESFKKQEPGAQDNTENVDSKMAQLEILRKRITEKRIECLEVLSGSKYIVLNDSHDTRYWEKNEQSSINEEDLKRLRADIEALVNELLDLEIHNMDTGMMIGDLTGLKSLIEILID